MNDEKLRNIVKGEYGKIKASQTEKERIRKRIECGLKTKDKQKGEINLNLDLNLTEVESMKKEHGRTKHPTIKRNGLAVAAAVVLCVGIGGIFGITTMRNNIKSVLPMDTNTQASSSSDSYHSYPGEGTNDARPSFEGRVTEVLENSVVKVQVTSSNLLYNSGDSVLVSYKNCGYKKFNGIFDYNQIAQEQTPEVNDIVEVSFWDDKNKTIEADTMEFYRNKKSVNLSDGYKIKTDGKEITSVKNGKIVSSVKPENIYNNVYEFYSDKTSDYFFDLEYIDGSIYDMSDETWHDGIICKKYDKELNLKETFYIQKQDDLGQISSYVYNEKTNKFYALWCTNVDEKNYTIKMKLYEYSPENKKGVCLGTYKTFEDQQELFFFSKSGDTFFYSESNDTNNSTYNVKAIALDKENKGKVLTGGKDTQNQNFKDGYSVCGNLVYYFSDGKILTYAREDNRVVKKTLDHVQYKCRVGELEGVEFEKIKTNKDDGNDYYLLEAVCNGNDTREGTVFAVNKKTGKTKQYLSMKYPLDYTLKVDVDTASKKITAYAESIESSDTTEKQIVDIS